MECEIEVGDKVRWQKYLLTGDGSGERKWFEFKGIVERLRWVERTQDYMTYIRQNNGRCQIVSNEDLEIVEKDALNGNKLEGNQIAMNL